MPSQFGFLSTKEYSKLTDIPWTTVKWNIENGKIFAFSEHSNTGQGGTTYRIPIGQLTPEGMIRYFKKYIEDPDGDKEIIFLPESELLLPANREKRREAIRRMNIARMADSPPAIFRDRKYKWYKYLADYYGLSETTIQRDMRKYEAVGPVADHFAPVTRSDRGKSRIFDARAIEILYSNYFGQPHITIGAAYQKTVEYCNLNGLSVGSLRSAQRLIQKCDKRAAYVMYRDEGRWALKNKMAPPILRDYNSLQVNDIWVGDQHRFNHWVVDDITKKVFRPEGFFWEDIKSRYVTGFEITRHYNSQTVASALIRGIIPVTESPVFGIPKMIYTDWGRPELSKYIQGVRDIDIHIADGKNEKLRKILRRYNTDEKEGIVTQLGIEPRQAIVRNPQAKPIERWFETLDQKLLDKGVPGYTGNTVGAMSEADIERLEAAKASGSLLKFSEFCEVVRQVVGEYNMAPHKGAGMFRRSPIQVWIEAYERGYRPRVISKHALEMLLLPWEKRVVQRDGVHYNNRIYRHPKLNHLIGENIKIAIDPDNINKASILKDNEYICTATSAKYIPYNAKSEIISQEIAKQREWIKMIVDEYDEIVAKNGDMKYIKPERPGLQKKNAKTLEERLNEIVPESDISQDDVWNLLDKEMAN